MTAIAMTYFPSNQTVYDNKTSGLKSTDVQGAIDELYNVCLPKTGGEEILDKVDIVSSGDGLYKDEYEDMYFYRGANANNYITFNNEIWRIVSIENDRTIKIIKNNSIENSVFHSSAQSVWSSAIINTYLNSTYLI